MKEPEKKKPAKKKTTSRTSTKTTRKKVSSAETTDQSTATPAKSPAKKKAAPAKAASRTAATKTPAKKKAATTARKKTSPSRSSATKSTETPAPRPTQEVSSDTEVHQDEGSELMVNGLKFFSQLAQTLSDEEASNRLISSMMEHDKKTGQTYLKIPVENERTIGDAIKMLRTLFKALQ